MIQANELRIGNLTYRIDLTNKNKSVIDKLTVSDIERIEHGQSKIYKYEPIDLDNELLEKLGFRSEESFCYELYDIAINTSRELIWIHTKCKNNVELEMPEYVHQLQNLYFALTKNELKL
jgi:hypothetical protein